MLKAWQLAIHISIAALLSAVLLMTAVLFTILLRYDQKAQSKGELHSVEITGEYSEEGGPWQTLTRQTFFQNFDLRDITVRGHFNRDLQKGAKLFLNLDHMRVSLKVNGKEIFRLEPVKGDGNPTRATGKQWVTVVSPGITTADTVELNFGNLYWNAYMIQFDELLWQMHTGDERMMLLEAIRTDGWTLGIGAVFLFLTLFLLVVSVCCSILKIPGALRFLWLGLASLFSAFWFFTLSSAPTLILPWPVFLNVLYAYSMQALAMFVVLFTISRVSGWRKQTLIFCEGTLLVALLVGLINQFLSIQDLYSAINWFSILDMLVALWLVFCLGYEAFRMKKKESAALLGAMGLLVFCAVLELINGYVQFYKAAFMLGVGLISFVVLEGVYTLLRIKQSMENEKRVLVLESELSQSRTAIMLSQIQPHFLYNSLLGIRQLCNTTPKTAGDALEHFAHYLRGNLYSVTDLGLIPFERELEHIQDYLYLETMRFGERLRVRWEIGCTEFALPPLTLQTIAENAVRHGITEKEDGGTLTIRTEETEDDVRITIMDDGVGFDTAAQADDSRPHIGLSNVKTRLAAQCGGRLQIESTPGVGTVVTILLPRKEDNL